METFYPYLDNNRVNSEIDIFEVLRMGLKWELAIIKKEVFDIYINSLCFAKDVFDYKFTAVVKTTLSQNEIESKFKLGHALD